MIKATLAGIHAACPIQVLFVPRGGDLLMVSRDAVTDEFYGTTSYHFEGDDNPIGHFQVTRIEHVITSGEHSIIINVIGLVP